MKRPLAADLGSRAGPVSRACPPRSGISLQIGCDWIYEPYARSRATSWRCRGSSRLRVRGASHSPGCRRRSRSRRRTAPRRLNRDVESGRIDHGDGRLVGARLLSGPIGAWNR